MNLGKLVFAQITQYLPLTTFRRCVARYGGGHKVKSFSCLDHYLCMAFAQLTYRESLRDIEACLRAQAGKLYHMGIKSRVSRSTLADANESRDWRIYADFAQSLIAIARRPYAAKSNLKAQRRYSHPVDRSTGLICDQTIVLSGFYSRQDFDTPLRRVRFKDPTTGKRLVFLTNNFILPAFTITELYRCRWQVELFFKWIKQHLRIKVFFGTSENAVKTQIWIAVSVYVLVAIVKKRLNLSASLYEMLQILSLTMFERIPLDQLLTKIVTDDIHAFSPNQLNLFN